jgi:hypothetical protein
MDRLARGGKCPDCAARHADAKKQARRQYESTLTAIAAGTNLLTDGQQTDLDQLIQQAGYSASELAKLRSSAFLKYAERMLADDILSAEEEESLAATAHFFGVTDIQAQYPSLLTRLIVARVNDGRLPVMPSPRLLTKAGEQVHAETEAQLLKEVAVREYRGGSQGVSLRIMKGVRYHVGASRGRMVQVGTQIVVEDQGYISVSSQRVVFVGQKTTLDVPLNRLVGLEMFSDGIRLNISNRKSAPLFRIPRVDVVGACLNAAVQRLN